MLAQVIRARWAVEEVDRGVETYGTETQGKASEWDRAACYLSVG